VRVSAAVVASVFITSCGVIGCQLEEQLRGKESGATYLDDGGRINKQLGMITPEQFADNLAVALSYHDKSTLREILADKMVALGGVDFRFAKERNHTPTGQSALTIRRLAWDIAHKIVERDAAAQAKKETPQALTIAQVAVDRPLVPDDLRLPLELQIPLQEGDERFRAQLDDLYWRLLSRPPTDAEREAMSQLFLTTGSLEGDARAGWTSVLFVLLASMEYWNI
jgi:hypothetical protein